MGHAINLALTLGVLSILLTPAPEILASPVVGGSIVSTSSNNKRNNSPGRDSLGTLVVTNEATYRRGVPTTTSRPDGRQGKQLRVDISRMFREDTKDYPDEEIRRLLKQTPDEVKDLYNVINTQLDPHMNLTERVAFYHDDSSSSSENVREESVCRSVTRNIYPREASRANSLVYIPNNQEFMQVIQADICQHPDQECSYLQDSLPYGMTSVCYQKYAYKKLLFMDPLEKRMASDLFRYPSCCACFIRTLPFDLRSSANNSTTSPKTALHYASESETTVTLSPSNNDNNNTTRSHLMDSNQSIINDNNRNSKQLQSSFKTPPASNHTVVLNEDKVYAPSDDKLPSGNH